jgi:hypothetical protein
MYMKCASAWAGRRSWGRRRLLHPRRRAVESRRSRRRGRLLKERCSVSRIQIIIITPWRCAPGNARHGYRRAHSRASICSLPTGLRAERPRLPPSLEPTIREIQRKGATLAKPLLRRIRTPPHHASAGYGMSTLLRGLRNMCLIRAAGGPHPPARLPHIEITAV